MKKLLQFFATFLLCGVFSLSVAAQDSDISGIWAFTFVNAEKDEPINILSGSSMELEDADAWQFSTLDSHEDTSSEHEFGYTDEVPAYGDGGALRITYNNIGETVHHMVYQEVTVKPGTVYAVDYAIKSFDGTHLSQYWAETFVGAVEPQEGADYVPGDDVYMIGGFKYAGWATECPTEIDGLLSEDNCLAGEASPAGIDPNSFTIDYIEEETTVFVGIKFGSWGTTGETSFVIDNFVMYDLGEASEEPEEFTYSISMLIPADDYQYKYFVVVDDATWDLGEWVGDPNRSVTVEDDMTIEDEWGVEPEEDDKFGDKGDALYNVTFKVTIEEGTLVGEEDLAFDPAEHHIFIAGSLPEDFGWFWNEPGSNPLLELTIGDDDPINLSTPDIGAPEVAVNIFPNPANDRITIQSDEQINEVRMVDVLGQVVYTGTLNDNHYEISVGGMKTGVYFVQLTTEAGIVVTQRVQVTR